MDARQLWPRFEVSAAIVLFIFSLANYFVAFNSPIYTDEIDSKLVQVQYVDKGFASRSWAVVPSCGLDTVATPVLLIPLRYFDSFVQSLFVDPRDLRIYGTSLFLAWFCVTWLLLKGLLAPPVSSREVLIGLTSVVTLGVMPLLLVVSRPEQMILVGLTVFLTLAVNEKKHPPHSLMRDTLLAVAMVFFGYIVLTVHPRASLILPIAVLACMKVVERRWLSFTTSAILAVIAVTAFEDFSTRLACPNDATVRAMNSIESIAIAASNHTLGTYFSQLGQMLRANAGYFFFLTQFDFLDYYTGHMIPAYPYRRLGTVISLFLCDFVVLLVLSAIASFAITATERIRRREGLIALGAIASSWMIYFVSIVARADRLNYEAELMEPLLFLNAAVSIWLARKELSRILGQIRVAFYARAFFAGLIVLSITSQIAFFAGYFPFVEGTWSRPGYVPGQRLSVAVNGYSSIQGSIVAAAARCGIKPDDDSKHLVLDEVTYFPFRRSKIPHLMIYMEPRSWGRGISNLRGLLAEKGSDGVIVDCHRLLPSLQAGAIRTGQFCCLPKF